MNKTFLDLLTTPKRRSRTSTILHGMAVAFFMCMLALQLHGVPEPISAFEVLTAAGYSNIELGDSKWMACGGDIFSTSFKAKSQTGTKVEGFVCGTMMFKSNTIRFVTPKK
jgi:hypothetical protein